MAQYLKSTNSKIFSSFEFYLFNNIFKKNICKEKKFVAYRKSDYCAFNKPPFALVFFSFLLFFVSLKKLIDCNIILNSTLENVLGKGAFAVVRKGINEETGLVVAVKIMRRSMLKRKRVGKWNYFVLVFFSRVGYARIHVFKVIFFFFFFFLLIPNKPFLISLSLIFLNLRFEGRFSSALDNVKKEIAIWKKLRHPNIVNLYEVIDDTEVDEVRLLSHGHWWKTFNRITLSCFWGGLDVYGIRVCRWRKCNARQDGVWTNLYWTFTDIFQTTHFRVGLFALPECETIFLSDFLTFYLPDFLTFYLCSFIDCTPRYKTRWAIIYCFVIYVAFGVGGGGWENTMGKNTLLS